MALTVMGENTRNAGRLGRTLLRKDKSGDLQHNGHGYTWREVDGQGAFGSKPIRSSR